MDEDIPLPVDLPAAAVRWAYCPVPWQQMAGFHMGTAAGHGRKSTQLRRSRRERERQVWGMGCRPHQRPGGSAVGSVSGPSPKRAATGELADLLQETEGRLLIDTRSAQISSDTFCRLRT